MRMLTRMSRIRNYSLSVTFCVAVLALVGHMHMGHTYTLCA